MKQLVEVIRREPRARLFLVTYLQSSLGTGAAAAGLVVLAYQRYRSPWAIALILLANFLPAMLLGPVFGAAVDRWSRRWCMIAADVVRAAAFVAIAAVHSFPATLAFALVAGVGTGIFSPAALAALPALVKPRSVQALTSLYGGVCDAGRTVGPLLAAIALPWLGAGGIMIANAATFAASALAIGALAFNRVHADVPERRSPLLKEAREGVVETARVPVVRVVLLASGSLTLFAAMMNVPELLLARDLGAGASGYSLLLAAWGIGLVGGSLAGSRARTIRDLRLRFLAGIFGEAIMITFFSVVPLFALALPAFAIAGFANGLVIVHQRLLIQRLVPDRIVGRAFAALDTVTAWAFTCAFLLAGALIAVLGTRGLIALAGCGGLVTFCFAAWGLARERLPEGRFARYTGASMVVPGVEREASTARTASL